MQPDGFPGRKEQKAIQLEYSSKIYQKIMVL
jgi:hypothetical protein